MAWRTNHLNKTLHNQASPPCRWIVEASHRGNVAADQQIMHMYRWLISHQSALYDPALHKLVNTLMKKVFHGNQIAKCTTLGIPSVAALYM